jgi:hypothetical protein
MLTTSVNCRLKSTKITPEKAAKIREHVEGGAALRVVTKFVDQLYAKVG